MPQIRLRGRIRIKTSYWGYRLKGEVFVNVNVKVNDGWWKVEGGRRRRGFEAFWLLKIYHKYLFYSIQYYFFFDFKLYRFFILTILRH